MNGAEVLGAWTTIPWLFVKILMLISLGLYVCFALIVIRQVRLMKNVLSGILEIPLTVVSVIHLLFVLFVFFLALSIL